MFKPGQTFGSYTLIRPLGRGGFGEVWLADRKSKFVTTQVAIKLPLSETVDHDLIRREASLWQMASGHPNVLPLIDADEVDGQIVIVSEYAPEGSLEDILRTRGSLPFEEATQLMLGVLDGLDFLHSKGIIHRDIKPGNILMQGRIPRLTDFGISRLIKSTASSSTENISGTFEYMSPEAFDGKRTVQTDIWSVGVVFYRLLTGRLPFSGRNLTELVGAILTREPAPLPPSTPPTIEEAISKALRKAPSHRLLTVVEMRSLIRFVGSTSPAGKGEFSSDEFTTVVAHPKANVASRPVSAYPHGQKQRRPLKLEPLGEESADFTTVDEMTAHANQFVSFGLSIIVILFLIIVLLFVIGSTT